MRLSLIFTALLALLVVALPPGIALAQGASPVRTLPQVISPGSTIEVRVTFTAPADNFNSIGISDTAPEGWNVTVDASWCDPAPEGGARVAGGNNAQFIWYGLPDKGFDAGTKFKVVYKVTVPQNASNASVESPAFNGTEGLEYYIGGNPYVEDIVAAGAGGGGGLGVGWIIGIVVGIVVIVAVVLLVRRRRKAAVSGG